MREVERLRRENERLRETICGLLIDLADTGTGLVIGHPAWDVLRGDDE